VLPLRAELWSGSPTKTRLPKPADVGVRECSPEMWSVPDGRWHEAAGLPSGASAALADVVASPKTERAHGDPLPGWACKTRSAPGDRQGVGGASPLR
jgi:hypothetical protein